MDGVLVEWVLARQTKQAAGLVDQQYFVILVEYSDLAIAGRCDEIIDDGGGGIHGDW